MFIFLCYNCYDSDYEIQKKTHSMCGNVNNKSSWFCL